MRRFAAFSEALGAARPGAEDDGPGFDNDRAPSVGGMGGERRGPVSPGWGTSMKSRGVGLCL
jgi:hypothetical protein